MAGSQKIQLGLGVGAALIPVFPPPFVAQRAPRTTDTNYPLGQVWIDNSVSPAVSYEYLGGGTWSAGGNAEATTSSFGIVQLATLTELQTGTAPAGAYVPTANDVATVIAGVVAGAVPPATTVQQGIVFLATNAQAVAGLISTNTVLVPANLPAVFAAAPAIGGTTPAAAVFTTLGATTVTFTAGGTWASGGTAISIGADATI